MQQFSVVHDGKKKLFKVSGSSTVAQATSQIIAEYDLQLDTGSAQLRYKKAVLDPSLPLRFSSSKIRPFISPKILYDITALMD